MLNEKNKVNQNCHPRSVSDVRDLYRGDKMSCLGLKASRHDRAQMSGRSLLETLATLAIMGLISAGGIVGYTRVMDQIRASRTVDRLMKRATDVASQKLAGQNPTTLSNWDENDGAYTIKNTITPAGNTAFALTVENVPKAVCERLLELQWPLATITPSKAEDCLEEADMTFTFNDDLTPRSGNSGGSSGGNSGNDISGGETTPETPFSDPCTEVICEENEVCDDGVCYPKCGTSDMFTAPKTVCDRCANSFWNEGTCYSCNASDAKLPSSETECQKCSNRWWYHDSCYLNGYFTPGSEYSYSAYSCVEKKNVHYSGNNSARCDQCTGEYKRFANCEATCSFSEALEVSSNAQCGEICENRELVFNGQYNYCKLKQCPDGYFARTNSKRGYMGLGSCVRCDVENSYSATAEECAKCGSQRQMSYGACALKRSQSCSGFQTASSETYQVPGRPLSTEFIDVNGYCLACSTALSRKTTEEECDKCANRTWTEDPDAPKDEALPPLGSCVKN